MKVVTPIVRVYRRLMSVTIELFEKLFFLPKLNRFYLSQFNPGDEIGVVDSWRGILLALYYIFAGIMLFFVGYYVVVKPVNYDAYDFEFADAAFSFVFFILYLVVLASYLTENTHRQQTIEPPLSHN